MYCICQTFLRFLTAMRYACSSFRPYFCQ